MKKHPREVPSDIYKLLKYKRIGKDVNTEFLIEQFGEEVKAALRDAVVAPEQVRKGRLRLSAIGKPDRQIYNSTSSVQVSYSRTTPLVMPRSYLRMPTPRVTGR